MLGQPLGEIERARPAGIVRVEVVELGVEFRDRPWPPRRPRSRSRISGISVSATKRPPKMPKKPRSSGPLAKRVELGLGGVLLIGGHRGSSLRRIFRRDQLRLAHSAGLLSGLCRENKAADEFGSFSPGRISTPEETSTAEPRWGGQLRRRCRVQAAGQHLVDANLRRNPASVRQSNAMPLPPGSVAPSGGLGVEQDQVGGVSVIQSDGGVGGGFDLDRFHHAAASRLRDLSYALRCLAAMELDEIWACCLHRCRDIGVGRIDQQRDDLGPSAGSLAQLAGDGVADVARALLKED